MRSQRPNHLGPGIQLPRSQRRLGTVIHHKPHVRQRSHGPPSSRQLMGQRQQVVDQPGLPHRRKPPPHILAAQPLRIRLPLHLMPNPLQPPPPKATFQPSQRIPNTRRGQIHPPHHRPHQRGLLRDGEKLRRLLRSGDGLHQHRPNDPELLSQRLQVRHQVVPPQNRPGDPLLIPHPKIPQVMMSVDDHGTGTSRPNSPFSRNASHNSPGTTAAKAAAFSAICSPFRDPMTTLRTAGCPRAN